MGMIDRVATALWNHEVYGHDHGALWLDVPDDRRADLRLQAAAAIRGMRQPTRAMFEACVETASDAFGGDLLPSAFDDFRIDYAAMIDAALAEETMTAPTPAHGTPSA